MNLKEFAALKVGDKIDNLMAGSHGEVVEVTSTTVLVRWHKGTAPRTYGANTTAWMHWDKADRIMVCPYCGGGDPPNHKPGCTSPLAEPAISPELDKALDAFVADKPADIAGPTHEAVGTGYDSGATGYELQGRKGKP